jgi:PAS domain S-box-containing protein
LALIAGLWVADLRSVWQSPFLFWLSNTGSAVFAIVFIVTPASRQFVARGQLSVLMLGCGTLAVQLGVFVGAIGLRLNLNAGFTIFTVSALLSALCHFAGVTLISRQAIRMKSPVLWLAGAYAGCMAVMGLVLWGALTARMPSFFSGVAGVTLVRSLVEGAAMVLFALTASLLWMVYRRAPSPFFYWYALGLGLLAASLIGHMVIAVGNSTLQWVARFSQALATVYMCLAVLNGARNQGTGSILVEEVEEVWWRPAFLDYLHQHTAYGWILRHAFAVVPVAVALGVHQALTMRSGPGLPTYLLFYPAVITVALVGGIGPGVLATVLAVVAVAYWILPPVGQLAVAFPMDRLGLVIFLGMGLCISLGAELFRRYRNKAAAYDHEAALRSSEARYRFLFETITEGFSLAQILFDAAGNPCDLRYLAVNPAFERHTGLKVADILGRTALELFPDAEPHRFEVYGKVARTGEPASFEAWFGPRGRCFQVSAFRAEPGVCGVIFFDITDRKRAEEQLQEARREAEQRARDAEEGKRTLDALLDYIPEGISIASAPDVITLGTSKYAERILTQGLETTEGMAMEDWLAKVEHYLADGVTPARPEDLPLWKAVKHGETVEGQEMVLRRPDGSLIHILCNAGPIKHDRILGGVVAWRDITARKQLEAKLTEEARRKDEFIALLGHELRNPLAPISNAIYLMRKGMQDPVLMEKACAIAENQMAHIVRLVDDLLDISRISRGKVQLKKEEVDLVGIMRNVSRDYQLVLEGHDLTLEVDLPAQPVQIDADPARIVQMVSNLLSNATKFTDPGGHVRLTVGVVDQAWCQIAVKDSGIGMPPELGSLIFEPFRQRPGTIGRARGGLGLGLALTKGLVELHGGTISAQSDGPGRGSEFIIRLPRVKVVEPPSPHVPCPEAAGSPEGRRILVVEDLVDAATTLRLLLEMSGHTVEVAHDGQSGLEKANRFKPEIILCDLGLPGDLDGHMVARIIRSTPGLAKTYLIALTGFGSEDAKEVSRKAGFDTHLTKPVDPEALQLLISHLSVQVSLT